MFGLSFRNPSKALMIRGPLRSEGAQYVRFPVASPPHENPLAKALAITSATILIPGSSSYQLSSNRWARYVRTVSIRNACDQRCQEHCARRLELAHLPLDAAETPIR